MQVERKDEAALALTAAKRERFAHAINDSTARTAELIGGGASPPGLEVHESAEIDAELDAVLARAQRLAQVSAGQRCTHDHAAMAIASQLAAMEGGSGGIQDGLEFSSLEFSETSEFCKAVRSKDEAEDEADELLPSALLKKRQQRSDSEAVGGIGDNGEGEWKSKVEVPTSTNVETGNESDKGADEKDDDSVYGAPFLYERKASSGMGAVLEIARNRGVLGDEAVASGRMYACPAT